MSTRSMSRLADRSERIGPPAARESYLSIEADPRCRAPRRGRGDPSRLRVPVGGRGVRSRRRGRRARLRRAATVGARGARQQARRAPVRGRRRRPDRAGHDGRPRPMTSPAVADIGYPVMLKAAAGGGGRGMRRVDAPDDLRPAMEAAQREAASAFGDGTIYVERLVVTRAPRGGAAPRRSPRQPRGARRARLLGPAPSPEARRGVAVTGGRRADASRRCSTPRVGSPAPSTSTTRPPSSSSSRRTAATTSSR